MVPRRLPHQAPGSPELIVVLGCRVRGGKPSRALLRRLETAASAHEAAPWLPILMSGGQKWEGHSEAGVMAEWWREAGRDVSRLTTEEHSLTTRQNAAEVAKLMSVLGYRHLLLVTCDFHMPRAKRLFEERGLHASTAAASVDRSPLQWLRLRVREWGAGALERLEDLVK